MLMDALRDAYYRLPDGLQRAVLVYRRTPVWLRAGVLFLHIPKAAGTSVNEALYGRFIGHVRATDVERWGSRRLNDLPSFAITRNPWDRLISAYRFLKRGGGSGGPNSGRVWRAEQYRVAEFETFDTFVKDWLAPRELATLDRALHPQHIYVCKPDGQIIVDHVGKLEDLAPTIDFLRKTLSTAPPIGHSNRSGAPTDYRALYTPDLVDIVRSIYLLDVQRFGYDFE